MTDSQVIPRERETEKALGRTDRAHVSFPHTAEPPEKKKPEQRANLELDRFGRIHLSQKK